MYIEASLLAKIFFYVFWVVALICRIFKNKIFKFAEDEEDDECEVNLKNKKEFFKTMKSAVIPFIFVAVVCIILYLCQRNDRYTLEVLIYMLMFASGIAIVIFAYVVLYCGGRVVVDKVFEKFKNKRNERKIAWLVIGFTLLITVIFIFVVLSLLPLVELAANWILSLL